MDDFLEQMLSTTQWGGDAGNSMNRSWGASATAEGAVPMDTIGGEPGMELPKLTQAYHLHSGHSGAFNTQMLGSHSQNPQENTGLSQNQYSFGPMPSARQPINPCSQSLMRGDHEFEGSGFQHAFPLTTPAWHQPYAGGVPPLPSTFGPTGKSENLGKRCRAGGDEEEDDDEETGNMGPSAAPQDFQSGQPFGSQSPLVPPNLGTADGKGTARPRVRARRGQATDPHSIAERHRRERIAERMKALQELVPDANKTDKASMLDEIIGYVRFLQMQVKCLSVCRLGAAGAGTPLFTDLPGEGGSNLMEAAVGQLKGSSSQENMAYAERQVATLMDEDMSAAMQYLQSKGLCLMPISLATAISTTSATSLSLGKPFSQQLPMPSNNNNNIPIKQVGESLTRDSGNSDSLDFSPPNDGFSSREDLT